MKVTALSLALLSLSKSLPSTRYGGRRAKLSHVTPSLNSHMRASFSPDMAASQRIGIMRAFVPFLESGVGVLLEKKMPTQRRAIWMYRLPGVRN